MIACQKDYTITVNAAVTVTEYWTLDEASGNRVGKVHSIPLTPTPNGSGFVPGITQSAVPAKFSNGVQLCLDGTTGGSHDWSFITTAFSADEQTLAYQGNGFSCAFWCKLNTSTNFFKGASVQVTIYDAGHATIGIMNYFPGDAMLVNDPFNFYQDTFHDNLTLNVWHFIHFFYDSVGQVCGWSVDNGTNTTFGSPTIFNVSAFTNFDITSSRGFVPDHCEIFDEVAVLVSRMFTPAEVTFLYNGGAGRTYPF